MKFVCDRCLTKYSIADDKVRGRILKIRCKSCSNIITVKESAPAPISVMDGESDRTIITSGPIAARPMAPAPSSIARAKAEPGRPLRPPTPPSPQPTTDDIQWFIAIEGVQKGPFARKALVDKLLTLPKNSDVHVWNDTLDGWKPPVDVPAIARDLQSRQKHLPAPPPPPPSPRLRPVPPPPSRGASGAHRLPHAPPSPHGGGAAHASAAAHAHAGGAHAHAAAVNQHHHPHPVASHSAVGLGLASVAPMPSAHGAASAGLDANAILDTPVPIRELVQAHKANGEARLSGSYATMSGVPHAPAANGESDALQALNLGQSWRQPGSPAAPAEASLSSAAMASAAHLGAARQRNRNLKLATGFIAFAAVCVVVIFFALKKPPPSASAASPPVAIGEAAGAGKAPAIAPKEVKDPTPGGESGEATGDTDAPGTPVKTETVARISSGKKPARQPGLRNPGRGAGAGTVPGSFTPEQLQQQQQAANTSRYADTSGKQLNVRPMAPTVAKVTPNQTDIAHVVNANKGGIKICYQRALLRDSSLTHGKIDVTVSIGISGRVKNVAIDGPSSFRTLDPCIKDVLSRWVFPASSEEYGTGFSYVFQGNE
jgi:predicted Zn finger-like uncharacterized protein